MLQDKKDIAKKKYESVDKTLKSSNSNGNNGTVVEQSNSRRDSRNMSMSIAGGCRAPSKNGVDLAATTADWYMPDFEIY